jgi:hypothetical protein
MYTCYATAVLLKRINILLYYYTGLDRIHDQPSVDIADDVIYDDGRRETKQNPTE